MPGTPEAFHEALEAFYKRHGKQVHTPSVDKQPLNLFQLFTSVAARGGYEVVTLERCAPQGIEPLTRGLVAALFDSLVCIWNSYPTVWTLCLFDAQMLKFGCIWSTLSTGP